MYLCNYVIDLFLLLKIAVIIKCSMVEFMGGKVKKCAYELLETNIFIYSYETICFSRIELKE